VGPEPDLGAPAGARNLSDEASGRPVGLPALAAPVAPDPETVPPAQARRSTGSGPVPDISSISDRDLLSYWRSFQPSQLGIRSAASSPFSLAEIEMERARRAPQGPRPITSNQQFAGTGEEGSPPRPAPIVTASGTTPSTVSAAIAEDEAGSTPRQSRLEAGLPSLRGTSGPRPGMYGRNTARLAERDASLDDGPEALAARSAGIAASRHGLPSGQSYREPEAGRSAMGSWTAGLPRASGQVPVLNDEGGVQLASYAPKSVAPPGSGAAAVAGNSNAPIVVRRTDSNPVDTPDFDLSLRRARSALPDRLAGSEDEARRLFGGDAEKRKGEALPYALMEAGLKIMGSTSPRLAGAVSEGGLAGLGSYRQSLEAARRDEKEGFGARMGIAAARAHQDAATAQTAGHLYGADVQAATARGNNATTLAAADLSGQYSLAGHQLGANTQLQVANINAGVHREGYEKSDPLRTAEWVMAAPEGPEREARLKAVGRDRYGALGGNHDYQLLNSFYQEVNRSRDDFKLPKEDALTLKPAERAAKERTWRESTRSMSRGCASAMPGSVLACSMVIATGATPPAAPAAPADPLGIRR
jgi:hypothetical protein